MDSFESFLRLYQELANTLLRVSDFLRNIDMQVWGLDVVSQIN
jgi:hypothetical protein